MTPGTTAATPTIHVEIWSDVVCPWCYIGKRRFERAVAELAGEIDVAVSYKPYQLDPTAAPGASQPVIEAYAKKFGGAERADQIIRHVTGVAADDGLEFHLERALRANTLLAHRLLWFAEQPDSPVPQPELEERLLQAYFVDGLDVGDPDTLATCAAEVGFDRDEVLAYLDSDRGTAEVRADIAQAADLGISAVPTYVVNGEWAVPGAQDSDTFVTVLRRARATASLLAAPRAMTDRLVFLHGFTQTHHHWHECAHLIASRLPVTPTQAFLDLPGHGLSPDDPSTIEDAAPLLGSAGGRGTYVAYSMGGRFALAALALRPPEIERLVVIGSTAGIVDPADRAVRVEEDERRARRIEEIGVAAFVDEWLAMPMFSGHRFGPHDRRHRAQNTARGLASSLRQAGSGAQQPVWESLAAVTVPVLVLAGERDSKFSALGQELAATIPGATFAAIEGAGHAAHAEQPVATATLIADWVLAQPTASPMVSSTP